MHATLKMAFGLVTCVFAVRQSDQSRELKPVVSSVIELKDGDVRYVVLDAE
jgi:hypothetical protein